MLTVGGPVETTTLRMHAQFPPAEAARAHALLAGRANVGKVVLAP